MHDNYTAMLPEISHGTIPTCGSTSCFPGQFPGTPVLTHRNAGATKLVDSEARVRHHLRPGDIEAAVEPPGLIMEILLLYYNNDGGSQCQDIFICNASIKMPMPLPWAPFGGWTVKLLAFTLSGTGIPASSSSGTSGRRHEILRLRVISVATTAVKTLPSKTQLADLRS